MAVAGRGSDTAADMTTAIRGIAITDSSVFKILLRGCLTKKEKHKQTESVSSFELFS